MLLKGLGESALRAKAKGAGDLADLGGLLLERLASGLDTELHDEGLGARPESLQEFAMQLPRGEVNGMRQLFHAYADTKVLADVRDGAIQLPERVKHLAPGLEAVDRPHESDEPTAAVAQRELIRYEPVGHPLVIEEELHDVQLWLTRVENVFIVTPEILRKAFGEEVEIIPADDLAFRFQSKARDESLAGAHDPEVAILCEKRDLREMIEEPVKGRVRANPAEKAGAVSQRVGRSRFHCGAEEHRTRGMSDL